MWVNKILTLLANWINSYILTWRLINSSYGKMFYNEMSLFRERMLNWSNLTGRIRFKKKKRSYFNHFIFNIGLHLMPYLVAAFHFDYFFFISFILYDFRLSFLISRLTSSVLKFPPIVEYYLLNYDTAGAVLKISSVFVYLWTVRFLTLDVIEKKERKLTFVVKFKYNPRLSVRHIDIYFF